MPLRLLIFEWLTGGGLWEANSEFGPTCPTQRCPTQQQGHSMLSAVVEDFGLAGFETIVPIDSRIPAGDVVATRVFRIGSIDSLKTVLSQQSALADATILIAPESDGCLERCLTWIDSHNCNLISPALSFVQITANKQNSASWLAGRGVSVPGGAALSQFFSKLVNDQVSLNGLKSFFNINNRARHRLVLKPIDGAGSEKISLITDVDAFNFPCDSKNWRIEEFVTGQPVSVSVLCGSGNGPIGTRFLPPTGQIFANHPFGNYVGAKYPLAAAIAERADRLARKTIAALPATVGYVGIDMVISDQQESLDCVIEVNPRLTMSYVTLRKICDDNLAKSMYVIAMGEA